MRNTGADALVRTMADNGLTVCFANPGTSEMHIVSALGHEPRVRAVLGLFEGVATGAADGYWRVSEKPACTLLHLGPGYLNGAANVHNARRAASPMVNLVGDHAAYHRAYDTPLTTDIEGAARLSSKWVKTLTHADECAAAMAEAVGRSRTPPMGPVTLIVPADVAWGKVSVARERQAETSRPKRVQAPSIEDAAGRIRSARRPVVLVGGSCVHEQGVALAGRLSAGGIRVLMPAFVAKHSRGAGRFAPDRMLYYVEQAHEDLEGVDLMVLIGAEAPVSYFAYEDKPSVLTPSGCEVIPLASPSDDAMGALGDLVEALDAPAVIVGSDYHLDPPHSGRLTLQAVGVSIARHLPENAIVCDELITSRAPIYRSTATARPHEWLSLTGGALGQCLPAAVGAAVAAPQRRVVALSGDGAAAYTIQALWTMARENLDIATVILANGVYRILGVEYGRSIAAEPTDSAKGLLDIGSPDVDWCALAKGWGVPAVCCQTAEDFDAAFARAMATPGPFLIQAVTK